MARIYSASLTARDHWRSFYSDLLSAALANDPISAEAIAMRVLNDSLGWQAAITT